MAIRPLKNKFDDQRKLVKMASDLRVEFLKLNVDPIDAQQFRLHINGIQNIILATAVEDQFGKLKG